MTAADTDALGRSAYEAVIGLEVHVQLATRTKMFCGCANRFGAEPNTLVCPVCLGLPGALPVINRQAVLHALRVVTACGCTIARSTKFDRKNYYYPDLPKGYQISQYDQPIGSGGALEFLAEGRRRTVHLKRIHMEEDAGKNIHVADRPVSLVDLNRAGVPLLEIVTEPDIRSPEEAGEFLRSLRLLMLYLGISDCNMEEGSLRCDVNVSIRPRGEDRLETRTEIKNLNSFGFIEGALRHEIARQIRLRESGGHIVQETRLYDPDRDETRSMRGKEEEHDYRYFPEPDLAPLTFSEELLAGIAREVPELPLARLERYQAELGLGDYLAGVLVRDSDASGFFERCLAAYPEARSLANWIVNAFKEEMKARKAGAVELGLEPERFVELVRAVDEGLVSSQKARDVLKDMIETGEPVAKVVKKLGLEQISDEATLRAEVEKVLALHPGPAEDVRHGKKNSINFLVGQVMRATRGKANPAKVSELIRELLGG